MRTGIKEQETKYFINEQRGVVVCVITGRVKSLGHSREFTVKGTAKCHADDKFDVVVGRRIAESRAKQKMFMLAKRYVEELKNKILLPAIEDMDRLINANNHCYNAEVNHINDLLI